MCSNACVYVYVLYAWLWTIGLLVMKLCMVWVYIHDVDLIDHMMKFVIDINQVSSLTMLMYDLDVMAYVLMIGLLSMCEVIGHYMYIALVDIDWGHELSLIKF